MCSNTLAQECAKSPEMAIMGNGDVVGQNEYGSDVEEGDEGLVNFVDANENFEEAEGGDDPERSTTHIDSVELKKFFERPVIIHSGNWTPNTSYSTLLYPWALWMSNKRVSNRLNNFRNFTGRLHVKAILNGNQFYWGALLMSYLVGDGTEGFPTSQPASLASFIPATQRPHVWMDPTTSTGGEMKLPFIWQQDVFDLVSGNPNDLGSIWLESLYSLRHAGGSTNPVRITVMAWCEDVELSAPTNQNMGSLVPQMAKLDGAKEGEYGKVSGPATAISKAAGMLKGIPGIGPYAMATQSAASGIAKVAQNLGFCRPRNLAPINPLKIQQAGNISSVDAEDTSITLALTDKQEVSVDPRIGGIQGEDPLAFANIGKIESMITFVNWDLADVPNTVIFSTAVNPINVTRSAVTGSTTANVTGPMGWMCAPFLSWRGSITYRFQVVASAFHQGRLLIQWDPWGATALPELNTAFSHIVDISETRDFTLTIGFGNDQPALSTGNRLSSDSITFSTSGIFPINALTDNGALTVYVLNDLVTSGVETSSVRLNIFAKTDDMYVFDPYPEFIKNLSPIPSPPETGRSLKKPEMMMSQQMPIKGFGTDAAEHIGTWMTSTPPDMAKIVGGEVIDSFRTCLKRYCYKFGYHFTTDGTYQGYTRLTKAVSPLPIYRLGTDHHSSNNSVEMNLYAWCCMCFYGWRGSYRVKSIPIVNIQIEQLSWFAQRGVAQLDLNPQVAALSASWPQINPWLNHWAGMTWSTDNMDNVLEVEVPYYNQARFQILPNSAVSTNFVQGVKIGTIVPPYMEVSTHGIILESIGEDFNFIFFMGVPPLWSS